MTDSETVCRANDHSSACWKPSQLSLARKGRPAQISHDVISADEANWLVSERKAAEIRVCLLGENLLYRRVLQSSQKEMEFYNCTLGGKSGFECCFSIEGLSSSHDGGQTLCHTVFELRGNTLIGITKQTYMIQSAESQSFLCRLSYAPGNVGLCTFLVESVEGQQSPPSYWQ